MQAAPHLLEGSEVPPQPGGLEVAAPSFLVQQRADSTATHHNKRRKKQSQTISYGSNKGWSVRG